MKRNALLLFFMIAKFALNYALVDDAYELHRDEFLHLDQAKHLDFGYLSVPPLTAWFAVIVDVLGGSEFWARFFPCLFGALSIAVVWKAIETLGGSWFALILGATSVLFSALLRLNMLFQPNSFEILAWTFVSFCFIKYVVERNPKWLVFAGIAFGAGLLNKYNIVFFAIAFAASLAIAGPRDIFGQRKLWIGIGLAFAIFLPNLIWQAANGFPVVHHMQLLSETQLEHVSASGFLKEQLLFFFGSVPVLIAGLAGLIFDQNLRQLRVFLWSFFIVLALFVALHAKGYYAISLYPIYFAFGAVVLEKRLVGKAGILLRGVCLSLPVGFLLLIYPIAFPVDAPNVISERISQNQTLHLARWEDGKDHDLPQDFADMLGWKELAQNVNAALGSLPKDEHTIVLCDNYGQAGAINYYLKTNKAVTMNADYVKWFDLSKPVVNVVLVREAGNGDPRFAREKSFFETVHKIGEIKNQYARENATAVYMLKNAKVDVNAMLRAQIKKELELWE